MFLNFISKY